MPNVRPVSITPTCSGVSARRACIMSQKLGYVPPVIHQIEDDIEGRNRYHPCLNNQDFKQRYKKYVLKSDVIINPSIYINDRGEYVIKI